MQKLANEKEERRKSYRPEQRVCPKCHCLLERSHILWRKHIITLTGSIWVTSWGYVCPNSNCPPPRAVYRSAEAEGLHLKKSQFGRDVVVHAGYRRFWYHQTANEIYEWLTLDLQLAISERQVSNLLINFLALLRAAQPAKVRAKLQTIKRLVIGLDAMQPEKGNICLYIVRELQLDLTLLAENLEESTEDEIISRLLQPLKDLANELGLSWHGVVSDAQETIQTAVSKALPGLPHQACQAHCLRKAGELTFAADRAMKTDLKAALRSRIKRVEQRIGNLPETEPYQTILADYADAAHSTLLEGGVAPFELGGIRIFDDLTALAASLGRCQKKRAYSPPPPDQNCRCSFAFCYSSRSVAQTAAVVD